MYGTVAKFRVPAENLAPLRALVEAEETLGIEGYLGSDLLVCDNHPDTLMLVVRFRDRASYEANAETPEQDARYREFRALMSEDPEWFDGEWASLASTAASGSS
jgi:quinol monooxygenase YgiN